MSKRKKAAIWVVALCIVCGLIIWHVVRWHSTGIYLELFEWLQTGKGYITVLYNLGLMLVLGALFVFNPILILRPLDPLWGAMSLIAIPIGLLVLVIINYGYFLTKLTPLEIALSVLVVGGLFGYCFTKSYILLGAGVLLFIGLLVWQLRKRKTLHGLETVNHP